MPRGARSAQYAPAIFSRIAGYHLSAQLLAVARYNVTSSRKFSVLPSVNPSAGPCPQRIRDHQRRQERVTAGGSCILKAAL
jgi:hypothetical protein